MVVRISSPSILRPKRLPPPPAAPSGGASAGFKAASPADPAPSPSTAPDGIESERKRTPQRRAMTVRPMLVHCASSQLGRPSDPYVHAVGHARRRGQ